MKVSNQSSAGGFHCCCFFFCFFVVVFLLVYSIREILKSSTNGCVGNSRVHGRVSTKIYDTICILAAEQSITGFPSGHVH